MPGISKHGKDRWRVFWREIGGRKRSRVVPSKKIAHDLELEIRQAQALGRDWQPAGAVEGPPLIDVADAYLEHQERVGRMTGRSAGQRATVLDLLVQWLTGELGEVPRPRHLSRAQLAAWFEHLKVTGVRGKVRSADTARRYVVFAELMWTWAHDYAEDRGWAEHVPPVRRFSPEVRQGVRQHRQAATWAEMARCVAELTEEHDRQLGVLLYYTGLRCSQAMALRRSDFDLKAKTLRVRGELGKSEQEKAGRIIPISPHLATWVASLGRGSAEHIVDCPRSHRVPRPRSFNTAWRRAGLPANRKDVWERRPHHAFRAGFWSSLVAMGAPVIVAEWLVGHQVAQHVPTASAYMDPEALGARSWVDRVPAIYRILPSDTLDR